MSEDPYDRREEMKEKGRKVMRGETHTTLYEELDGFAEEYGLALDDIFDDIDPDELETRDFSTYETYLERLIHEAAGEFHDD